MATNRSAMGSPLQSAGGERRRTCSRWHSQTASSAQRVSRRSAPPRWRWCPSSEIRGRGSLRPPGKAGCRGPPSGSDTQSGGAGPWGNPHRGRDPPWDIPPPPRSVRPLADKEIPRTRLRWAGRWPPPRQWRSASPSFEPTARRRVPGIRRPDRGRRPLAGPHHAGG